ncbi:MAG: methyltransferase domain-containing protein [Bacteroidetes bacterium]|nr:methyltransferase domain-containing protein [Bacteroidota bacterium]
MNNLSKIYDEFADQYKANRDVFDLSDVFESFYTELNQSTGSVLDLGCGAGDSFSKFFVQRNWEITGVDFSERMLHLANQFLPEMKTIQGNMLEVNFPDQSFDTVVAIYSFFHLPSKDHRQMFSKIRQWLKPEGKALITYAGTEYTGSETFDGTRQFMGKDLYYGHLSKSETTELLKDVGFELLNSRDRTIGGETFWWLTLGTK